MGIDQILTSLTATLHILGMCRYIGIEQLRSNGNQDDEYEYKPKINLGIFPEMQLAIKKII